MTNHIWNALRIYGAGVLCAWTALASGVTVTPSNPVMVTSQGQTFSATISGVAAPVTWSLAPGSPGTLSSTGVYTAPASIPTPPQVATCGMFPNNNVWNVRVDNLPVDANSAAYINSIGPSAVLYPDFSNQYADVPGTQPKVPVTFTYASESDPGPYPIPSNAPIQGGSNSTGDRHVWVLDHDNCVLYELYNAWPQSDGSWTAGAGAIFDLKSNALRPASWTSADAAGLPMVPGMIRYDEVAAGAIRHAIRFTVPYTRQAYIWPARHFASWLTGTQYPPMGQRFRLKASYDISGFSPAVQVILTAMKQYGLILADNGSPWNFDGVADSRWNMNDILTIKQVLGSNLEAVDESSLMLDPNAGLTPINTALVMATSTSNTSLTGTSAVTVITPGNHPPTSSTASAAVFVKTDSTTQGNWQGVYGADGFNVLENAAQYPAYVAVTPSGQSDYVWSASTSDPRALQKAPPATDRIAGNWYSGNSLVIDVVFSDGNTHQVAVYCLDWDYQGRAETVSILDASGNVLDSRSIASFGGGQYLVWNLSGHVQIKITQSAGSNAVVSGLFFGGGSTVAPPPTAGSTATFVAGDATTQGNWRNSYGADGYNVIGDLAAWPSYVTASASGASTWVWANATSDVRALQKVSAPTDRIAAAWYSSSFTIDLNFTDGKTHQVALYCLDWDYRGRAQTVSVLDATTNALLDSRPMASFSGGLYLVWKLSGHVHIQVSGSAGPNAVVSGVFFGGASGAAPAPSVTSASFVKNDATTQGNWQGVYGAAGYNVIGGPVSYPSYAAVSPSGQSSYTWAASVSDMRALQTPTGRVAATWYSGTPFSIAVSFTDGKAHQIAIYCLDWDYQGRAQSLTITDANGSTLDSRSISNFGGGQYLVWNVSGSIKIQVASSAGPNAVISGLFLQ